MLITAPISGLDQCQPSEQCLAIGIPPLKSVRDHLERLACRCDHIYREFIEEALHPQQWRDVGFKIDAARHI